MRLHLISTLRIENQELAPQRCAAWLVPPPELKLGFCARGGKLVYFMVLYHRLVGSLHGQARRAFQLKRAVELVWRSSPRWTMASASLVIVQGVLPLISL